MKTNLGFCVLAGLWLISDSARSETKPARDGDKKSAATRLVTGPTEPINRAVAAGATAIMTLQPVPPAVAPDFSQSIMGQKVTLGAVPARVWIEGHITGWAPETLGTFNHSVDALDFDGDGGGYDGDLSDCNGVPHPSAGDLAPALEACTTDADCLLHMSRLSEACALGPVSRCRTFDGVEPDYFPAGQWCEPLYINRCSPRHICQGIACTLGFDYSTLKFRFGGLALAGEVPTDFQPSQTGTFVLDVPVDAKGTYTIDLLNTECFLQNTNPPGENDIPVAELRPAFIEVPCGSCCSAGNCTDTLIQAECALIGGIFRPGATCEFPCCTCLHDWVCSDNNACTVDTCDGCNCVNTPIAGWDPETECCNPMNAAQGPIPASTPCRTGGCSMGGSRGNPTITNIPDGTACTSIDPCFGEGHCAAGLCMSEQYAGTDCPKVRFISFDAGEDTVSKAWRVRLVSLHRPTPPYAGGPTSDFTAHEGGVRWVGPPETFAESTSNPTPVHAAVVQCQPHYQDWTGYDLLHVTGGEIVPSSEYAVQSIAQGLDINNEANYSAPMIIRTARWADLVIPNSPPGTTIQPDTIDISKVMDKFRSTSQSVSKPRALMVGSGMSSIPSLLGDVSFVEISAVVDAVRGRGYPYPWPAPCP